MSWPFALTTVEHATRQACGQCAVSRDHLPWMLPPPANGRFSVTGPLCSRGSTIRNAVRSPGIRWSSSSPLPELCVHRDSMARQEPPQEIAEISAPRLREESGLTSATLATAPCWLGVIKLGDRRTNDRADCRYHDFARRLGHVGCLRERIVGERAHIAHDDVSHSNSARSRARLSGFVVGAKRAWTLPALSIRNLVKFHFMVSPSSPPFCFLSQT
jgi:hypothetical protein